MNTPRAAPVAQNMAEKNAAIGHMDAPPPGYGVFSIVVTSYRVTPTVAMDIARTIRFTSSCDTAPRIREAKNNDIGLI
jgi:hypothetical protein